jgi:hypothetical protein
MDELNLPLSKHNFGCDVYRVHYNFPRYIRKAAFLPREIETLLSRKGYKVIMF